MALINCPECAYLVSEKARACVNCGFPVYGEITSSRREPALRGEHEHELVNGRDRGRLSRAMAAFVQVSPLVAALVIVAWWWGAGGIS